jgi:hypothetical protein
VEEHVDARDDVARRLGRNLADVAEQDRLAAGAAAAPRLGGGEVHAGHLEPELAPRGEQEPGAAARVEQRLPLARARREARDGLRELGALDRVVARVLLLGEVGVAGGLETAREPVVPRAPVRARPHRQHRAELADGAPPGRHAVGRRGHR